VAAVFAAKTMALIVGGAGKAVAANGFHRRLDGGHQFGYLIVWNVKASFDKLGLF